MPRAKLTCLDGLRGIAVLLVILFHLKNDRLGSDPTVGGVLWPLRYGYSGVHLFLVLSGFCLTHSILRRSNAGRPQTYGSYMKARWWRIAPPYYVAIGLGLAVPLALRLVSRRADAWELLDPRQIGTHALFVHGLSPDTIDAINPAFWSLSLEFQFYLVLPLLVPLARRIGVGPLVLGVACVSLAWRAVLLWWLPDHEYLVNGFLPGRLTEFALGIALASWYNAPDPGRLGRLPWQGAAVLAFVSLTTAIGLTEFDLKFAANFAFGAGYASLVLAALLGAEGRGRLSRVLEAAPLVWFGVISYSLYLTHGLPLGYVATVHRRIFPEPGPLDWVAVAVALGGVMLLGWGFFRVVERRFLRSIDAARPESDTAASPGSNNPPNPNGADPLVVAMESS